MFNSEINLSELNKKNPLFDENLFKKKIDLKRIKKEDFIEAIDTLIDLARQKNEEILNKPLDYYELFESNIYQKQLNLVISYLSMLSMSFNSEDIQYVYESKIGDYINYCNEITFDERCYKKIKKYMESPQYNEISDLKRKILTNYVSNLEIGGIHLSAEKKKRLKEIAIELSTLSSDFDNNLMITRKEMSLTFTLSELEGLSKNNLSLFEKNSDNLYVANFLKNNFNDILNNCTSKKTRKKVYNLIKKFGTWKQYNNRDNIKKIVSLSHEKARILGFKNYAEFKMSNNMVKDPNKILNFLNELGEKSLKKAKKEYEQITEYAHSILGESPDFCDISFVINKIKSEEYKINGYEQRQYFPLRTVLKGLFEIVENLYAVKFIKNNNCSLWDNDIEVYTLYENDKEIGSLFLDLYKKEIKEQGAYMFSVVSHDINEKNKQRDLPISSILLNIIKSEKEETTLNFNEIISLFHEMGHALHHLLTKVEKSYFSGVNGVTIDSVEFPSQFFENLCFDYDILRKISKHIKTGEKFPYHEYEKFKKNHHFLSGERLLRQVIMAEIDMKIYTNPDACPFEIEKQVREKWKYKDIDYDNMIIPSFSHIISEGTDYSASYYSYLWSEVMSLDALGAIKDCGNDYEAKKEVNKRFKKHILETGGEHSMLDNFIKFRGREPNIKYLLENYGFFENNKKFLLK